MKKILRDLQGFTLIELMVVLAIAIIVTVLGVISMNSRVSTARLEEATKTLASDVMAARGAAMFRGCPTRIIICPDKDCNNAATNTLGGSSTGNYIAGADGQPARFYAILRMSRPTGGSCVNTSAILTDGYTEWDFEKRPQALPRGVAFSRIYKATSGSIEAANWIDSTTNTAEATNSLWFNSSTGGVNVPVAGNVIASGSSSAADIAFQLGIDSCSPASDADCAGYFVTIGSGGVVNMVKCAPGSRALNETSNTCFP